MRKWKDISIIESEFLKIRRQWAKDKWEFMRDDPEYIDAFNQIKNNGDRNKEKEYCRYFGVFANLIDPQISYQDIIDNGKEPSIILWLLGKHYGVGEVINDDRKNNILTIKRDFNKVNSLSAMKKQVETIIDEFILLNRLSLKTIELQENFEKIRLVGRLKASNSKLTYPEIAKEVFSSNSDSLESDIKKAQQHYKRYLQLRNGGWRKFKFP